MKEKMQEKQIGAGKEYKELAEERPHKELMLHFYPAAKDDTEGRF